MANGQTPYVVVIGDVMTDIVVRPASTITTGSDTPSHITVHAGGSAANQAAWLASLGLGVTFIGAAGRDPLGRLHQEAFARAGVNAVLVVDPVRPTGMVVALIDPTGERTMLTERGANASLSPEALPADRFIAGSCLLLSGYTLIADNTHLAALAALALARARGMRIAVDPASAAPLAAVGSSRFLDWTRGANLCLPNLDEARVLTGASDLSDAAARLADVYGEVVVKLGVDGALWVRAGFAPLTLPSHQPQAAPVIDSTGAGDAFCAGFLSKWLRGASPDEALAEGIRLGAIAAARVGARPPGADLLQDDA